MSQCSYPLDFYFLSTQGNPLFSIRFFSDGIDKASFPSFPLFYPTVIIVLAIVLCLIQLQTSMRVIWQLHCVFWSVNPVLSFWFAVPFLLGLTLQMCCFWWICSSSQGSCSCHTVTHIYIYLDVWISFSVQQFQVPEIWNILHFPHISWIISHVYAVLILWITNCNWCCNSVDLHSIWNDC